MRTRPSPEIESVVHSQTIAPYGYVYSIKQTATNKYYVGQTRNPEKRWREHCSATNSAVSREIAEYGTREFEFKIIDVAYSKTELNSKKRDWIFRLRSYFPLGFNTIPLRVPPGPQTIPNASEGWVAILDKIRSLTGRNICMTTLKSWKLPVVITQDERVVLMDADAILAMSHRVITRPKSK